MTKKDQALLAESYIRDVILNEKFEIIPQGKSPGNADQYTVAINGEDVARITEFQGTVTVSVKMDANKVLGASFKFPIPRNQKLLANLHGKQFNSLNQFQLAAEELTRQSRANRGFINRQAGSYKGSGLVRWKAAANP